MLRWGLKKNDIGSLVQAPSCSLVLYRFENRCDARSPEYSPCNHAGPEFNGGPFMDDAQLIEQLLFSLKLRSKAQTTQEAYVKHLKNFFAYLGKDPLSATHEDLQKYQVHLLERGLAPRTINQMVASPKFFYLETLRRDWPQGFLPWVKVKRRLPKILTHDEILRVIQETTVFKMRVLFLTVYACGLRTCEVQRLTHESIDSARMQLRVLGKGDKERFVPISDVLLKTLRFYWKENYENKWTWLFPSSHDPKRPLHGASIRRNWVAARNRAGLTHVKGIHTLRHCYATHLLEAGVDIRVIQILIGHALLSTTTFYTQLTQKHAAQIKNPLDLLAAAVDPRLKASGQN
jgi:integrase/recombinase XerD